MASRATSVDLPEQPRTKERTAFRVLLAISFCHLLNDMVQSLIPALYPILKDSFRLDFTQIGMITLVNQATASLLQPVVGLYTDRNPKPYSLAFGMLFTLVGIAMLAAAGTYSSILFAVALVGFGSAVFHPESSRVARAASGGQYGLAQSVFQVGGNAGSAIGPLVAAFVVQPRGQGSVAWFSGAALLGIVLLTRIGAWYRRNRLQRSGNKGCAMPGHGLSRSRVAMAVVVLLILIFSKYFYLASLSSYYTFYLMSKFGVSVQNAQVLLFVFLGAVAAGTIIGGPIGDRIGRKYVIWGSILGVLPFSLLLPYVSLFWTTVLTVIIGVVLASAFSAILVYAQELMPGNVGMISGLFFGFAFGMGGLGAAVLGKLADATSIEHVYRLCAFLPAIGLLTAFLPDLGRLRHKA
jgi:FSR family fosmidomycin resistance protein-like MFS transporter